MDIQQTIEHLCSKGHRGSTTPEEEWAAREVEARFRAVGLTTELQRFSSHRTFGERLIIHLVPALFLGGMVPFFQEIIPAVLFLLSLLIISFTFENILLLDVLSRIIPLKPSVNVVAFRRNREASRRIVITAHHDSQKEGQIFNPRLIELMQGQFSVNSRITPIHLTMFGIVGLLCTSGAFLLDLTGNIGTFHILSHWLLLTWTAFATGLVLQWTLNSRFVPGANDNATGVAVMLAIAEALGMKDFPDVELCFLSAGCEETGMGGSLAFIRDNREFLGEKRISVLCLDGFGSGDLRNLSGDGMLMTRPYDAHLIAMAQDLSQKRYGEDRSFISRIFTDGLAFSTRGYAAITFGCLPEDLTLANYHWRTDTPENVNFQTVREARDFLQAYVDILASDG